mmetsp:Transcript_25919/g.40819  ORF Transcript_25919/g.40819 Transcript_25919/m.40819 type:complete len:192 (-) Transcript_25919:124-699(-)
MEHHGVASKKKRKKKKKKKNATKSNNSSIETNEQFHESEYQPKSSVHDIIDSNAKKEYDQVDTHLVSSPPHTAKSNTDKYPPAIRKEHHPPSPRKTAPRSATPVPTKSTPHPFERTPKKPIAEPAPFRFERAAPRKGYAAVNRQSAGAHRRKWQQREEVLQLHGKLHTQGRDNPFTFGFSGILPRTRASEG